LCNLWWLDPLSISAQHRSHKLSVIFFIFFIFSNPYNETQNQAILI